MEGTSSSNLHAVVDRAESVTVNDCRKLLEGRTLFVTSKILRHVHAVRPGQQRKQRYKLRPWSERFFLLRLASREVVEGWVREAERLEKTRRR